MSMLCRLTPQSPCKAIINLNKTAATIMVAGIVIAQVVAIWLATYQRTLLMRSDAPEPIKDVLITCGLLTGIPKAEAVRIIPDEAT